MPDLLKFPGLTSLFLDAYDQEELRSIEVLKKYRNSESELRHFGLVTDSGSRPFEFPFVAPNFFAKLESLELTGPIPFSPVHFRSTFVTFCLRFVFSIIVICLFRNLKNLQRIKLTHNSYPALEEMNDETVEGVTTVHFAPSKMHPDEWTFLKSFKNAERVTNIYCKLNFSSVPLFAISFSLLVVQR